MLDIIHNNPYRIIGVYSNGSLKEITANKTKLAAYAKVGKSVEFSSDTICNLPKVERDSDAIDKSSSKINLPIDKVKYSLFWFIKSSEMDEIALNHLGAGNEGKALEILQMRANFSSVINIGVFYFLKSDFNQSVAHITQVIHNDEYRKEFLAAVADSTFKITEGEMMHLYVDTLLEVLPAQDWMQIFKDSSVSTSDSEYIQQKLTERPRKEIERILSAVTEDNDKSSVARYNAGRRLVNEALKPLAVLKKLLGEKDVQYQMIADKLAKEILQCAIDYYNNSTDEDSIEKAMDMQKHTLTIAVSSLLRERCNENYNTLVSHKKHRFIKGYIDELGSLLKSFSETQHSLDNTKNFVIKCKRILSDIAYYTNDTDEDYIKFCSVVVNLTVNALVDVINKQQSVKSLIESGVLKRSVTESLGIMALLERIDMDQQTKVRYNNNKKSLLEMQETLKVVEKRIQEESNQIPAWAWFVISFILLMLTRMCS